MSDETPIDEFELKPPDDLNVRRCYRHPGRETGVSCANCDRPICHECMIPAAVGFWCPQCVAEQRQDKARAQVVTRSQTRARWQASGGALTVSGSPVTRALIVINVIMFLLEVVLGGTGVLGGALPYRVAVRLGALVPYDVIVHHEYWRLGAAMFLHGSILHILMNMWALAVIGPYLERRLGRGKFLAVYLISGLAGTWRRFSSRGRWCGRLGRAQRSWVCLGLSSWNACTAAACAIPSCATWQSFSSSSLSIVSALAVSAGKVT